MTEQWRAIDGYDYQYEISDHGNVRRLRVRRRTYRPIVGGWAKGYRLVLLRRGGKRIGKTVHSLVLEAFVGPRPSGHITRHLDGNKLNNRLDNLAWGTVRENTDDKVRHMTIPSGESAGQAKLTANHVWFIRQTDLTSGYLARMFGVGATTIKAIRKRTSWRTVP